jgi:hypothetical protein
VNRLAAPAVVLVVVTALFLGYGRFGWSWLAGPVSALAIWALDRKAQTRVGPAPVD